MTIEFSWKRNHSQNMCLGLKPGLCGCGDIETKPRIPDMATIFVSKPLVRAFQLCGRVILDITGKRKNVQIVCWA